MYIEKVVLTVLVAAGVWEWDMRSEAATTASVRLCGRKLSDIMSRVCHEYNSPAWDDPPVVRRRRRHVGIADECCTYGCTWEQLTDYCAVSTNSESPPLDTLGSHQIADRSVEHETAASVSELSPPAVVGGPRGEARVKNVARAAPVVGTVSPLLTWGRTLHADLPAVDRDRYAYVAVYTNP